MRVLPQTGTWGGACIAALSLLLLAGGCASSDRIDTSDLDEPVAPADDGEGEDDAPEDDFPETGINNAGITVTGAEPDSGPFGGGNQVVVRGSGFTEQALIFFDGRMVQPANTVLRDSNSLLAIVPAGEAGPADVTVLIGTEEVTREAAYTYNPLMLEPRTGSIAGGTSVVITLEEAGFEEGVTVHFNGEPCSDLRVVTPSTVRCKTPRGDVGRADVIATWPEEADRDPLEALEAFEYIDLTDTDRGGLNGGPIEGTLNITVVDSFAGLTIPDALVVIGDDPDGPLQGRTDSRGQITFSGDEVQGPLTVHVAGNCLEKMTIVGFDAENATIHVTPLLDPSCGMPGDPPPPGRGTAGALISGELVFPGSDEFEINAWDNVPEPRDNEVRVAYVFTTRSRVGVRNPSPAISGTTARVVEETSDRGRRGYPYRIFARPAGMAVYAISGLERRDTGEFTPYVMGVTRDIVTAPGDETVEVDIMMDIPLDRELSVVLKDLPAGTVRGPDQFRVQAHVDLGGEGVIFREINGWAIDVVSSFTAGSLFRFFAQPALVGTLGAGRYQVIAGWYTGDRSDQPPLTQVRLHGVPQLAEPLEIVDFLAIPRQVAPLQGAPIPDDRVLRWEISGQTPDFHVISIFGGDNLPAWTQIVPGRLTESAIPDFSAAEDVDDIAPGVITWNVQAIRMEDFDFDQLKFNQIDTPRLWSHTSVDSFTMMRR